MSASEMSFLEYFGILVASTYPRASWCSSTSGYTSPPRHERGEASVRRRARDRLSRRPSRPTYARRASPNSRARPGPGAASASERRKSRRARPWRTSRRSRRSRCRYRSSPAISPATSAPPRPTRTTGAASSAWTRRIRSSEPRNAENSSGTENSEHTANLLARSFLQRWFLLIVKNKKIKLFFSALCLRRAKITVMEEESSFGIVYGRFSVKSGERMVSVNVTGATCGIHAVQLLLTDEAESYNKAPKVLSPTGDGKVFNSAKEAVCDIKKESWTLNLKKMQSLNENSLLESYK
ncbi:unnamed protein product [Trichogramma brassicae]|uniref:Uncharacterized protein n=1 Tax=Trichogramma brassicae TaxID=86971 RepID=A0A6H5IM33_9HYME|nr:unnamed protein product [Trichogramma brassicae]